MKSYASFQNFITMHRISKCHLKVSGSLTFYEGLSRVKGSLTQNFRLQVFLRNQFPLGPRYTMREISIFLQKFAEIFERKGKSIMPMTHKINLKK